MFYLTMAIIGLLGGVSVKADIEPAATGVHSFEPSPETLPLILYDVPVGTEKTATIEIPFAPEQMKEAALILTIHDMDEVTEGQIYINGQGPLEPPVGLLSPTSTLTGKLVVNPKWFRKGTNKIKFVFADDLNWTTGGFIVEGITLRLTAVALGQTSDADGPLQPVFRLNMDELSLWRRQFVFHRSAKGELVLIEPAGPDAVALASTDEGRTWHKWPAIHTWPKGAVTAVARKGKELLIQVGTSIWRSDDEGQTWTGGAQFLSLSQRVNNKLLWYTPGDRILVTKAGRLLVAVDFLLGGEGTGPEIIGSLVSEDNGRSWRIYELFGPPPGYRDRPEGFGEPKLVELADGRIWMVFRTPLGHLWQAFSTDGGRTWGKPSSTGLVSLLAPLNAQRIPGTKSVVVVWANSKPTPTTEWKVEHNFWMPRRPFAFAVSHDNCQTWSRPVIITKNIGFMRNIYFSDKEMFINYEERGLKHWGPGATDHRPKLVIYDLKKVLALQPKK